MADLPAPLPDQIEYVFEVTTIIGVGNARALLTAYRLISRDPLHVMKAKADDLAATLGHVRYEALYLARADQDLTALASPSRRSH